MSVGVVAPLLMLITATSSKLDERVGASPGASRKPGFGLAARNSSTHDAECERWMPSSGPSLV